MNQPLPGATRSWLPCIDRISDRCTWDMEFIVPQRMGTLLSEQNVDNPFDDDEETIVVCSGDVVEQVISVLCYAHYLAEVADTFEDRTSDRSAEKDSSL